MTSKLPKIIRCAWGSDGVHRGDEGKPRPFIRTRYRQKSAGARLCGAIKTCLAAGLIAASLASLPQAGASPLAMPERGVILTGAEKQTYIANKMQVLFRPQPNAAAQPFAAPDGWTWTHENIGGIRVEHMHSANKETNRVILQLHGGGYVLGMSDAHRLLAIRQAVRTRAAEVYAGGSTADTRRTLPACACTRLPAIPAGHLGPDLSGPWIPRYPPGADARGAGSAIRAAHLGSW